MTSTFEEALRRYQSDAVATPNLKASVVAELVERGLVSRPSSSPTLTARPWLVAAAALAAAVLVFFALDDGSRDERPLYALVLDTVSENYSQMEPRAAELLAERYTAWIDRIRASGNLAESYYLRSVESTIGIDAVSGIVVIRAGSMDEVRSIIADSPHVERGGTIAVREVVVAEPRD